MHAYIVYLHLSSLLYRSLPPSAAEPDPQPKSEENEPTVIPLYEVRTLSLVQRSPHAFVHVFVYSGGAGC